MMLFFVNSAERRRLPESASQRDIDGLIAMIRVMQISDKLELKGVQTSESTSPEGYFECTVENTSAPSTEPTTVSLRCTDSFRMTLTCDIREDICTLRFSDGGVAVSEVTEVTLSKISTWKSSKQQRARKDVSAEVSEVAAAPHAPPSSVAAIVKKEIKTVVIDTLEEEAQTQITTAMDAISTAIATLDSERVSAGSSWNRESADNLFNKAKTAIAKANDAVAIARDWRSAHKTDSDVTVIFQNATAAISEAENVLSEIDKASFLNDAVNTYVNSAKAALAIARDAVIEDEKAHQTQAQPSPRQDIDGTSRPEILEDVANTVSAEISNAEGVKERTAAEELLADMTSAEGGMTQTKLSAAEADAKALLKLAVQDRDEKESTTVAGIVTKLTELRSRVTAESIMATVTYSNSAKSTDEINYAKNKFDEGAEKVKALSHTTIADYDVFFTSLNSAQDALTRAFAAAYDVEVVILEDTGESRVHSAANAALSNIDEAIMKVSAAEGALKTLTETLPSTDTNQLLLDDLRDILMFTNGYLRVARSYTALSAHPPRTDAVSETDAQPVKVAAAVGFEVPPSAGYLAETEQIERLSARVEELKALIHNTKEEIVTIQPICEASTKALMGKVRRANNEIEAMMKKKQEEINL